MDDPRGSQGIEAYMSTIRIIQASTSVLEHILCHDTCDVDLRNRLNGDTPLHLAVRQRWEDMHGLRLHLGDSSAQNSSLQELIVVDSRDSFGSRGGHQVSL